MFAAHLEGSDRCKEGDRGIGEIMLVNTEDVVYNGCSDVICV